MIKIEIDGEPFMLDETRAKTMGVLKSMRIESFEVGDVFKSKTSDPIIVVKPIWTYRDDTDTPSFGLLGLYHGLSAFSNYDALFTKRELLNHLNSEGFSKIGNITTDVENLIRGLNSDPM